MMYRARKPCEDKTYAQALAKTHFPALTSQGSRGLLFAQMAGAERDIAYAHYDGISFLPSMSTERRKAEIGNNRGDCQVDRFIETVPEKWASLASLEPCASAERIACVGQESIRIASTRRSWLRHGHGRARAPLRRRGRPHQPQRVSLVFDRSDNDQEAHVEKKKGWRIIV